jgi:hypothetical protein
MPIVQQQTSLESGYATIRRSKSRVEQKLRASSSDSNKHQQFEMIDMSSRRNRKKFESEIVYAQRNVSFDESSEIDEGVLNDIDESDGDAQSAYSDGGSGTKRQTFETFKPRNSIESGDDGSDKDLQQSSECFQSLPYDIIMSPLKSPQYINQLNAMRSKAPSSDGLKQFPLYARPESPKYGKLLYNSGNNNRSTSPSADSLDNSSSNSSTYSTNHHHTMFKQTAMSQSLHIPHPHGSDENVILINIHPSGQKQPQLSTTTLSYRKSFSHVPAASGNDNGSLERINKAPLNSMTMTKSLYNPVTTTTSVSTHLCSRRFATLGYQKEKVPAVDGANKSTSSLNERNLIRWDPILSCKIGSQTTLRTKPPVPWWELAIKKEFRQSCPPLHKVNNH